MANKKAFRIVLVILWLVLIFVFSSFDGAKSVKQSDKIIYTVVDSVSPNKSEAEKTVIIKNNRYIVRKIAHFLEYLILGILIFRVLILFKIKNLIILAFSICFLGAVLDETHQCFVSDRSPRVFDVFVDSCGSLSSIVVCHYIVKKKKN